MSTTALFQQPNARAPQARLVLAPDGAIFRGYQNFTLTPDSVLIDATDLNLLRRYEILAPLFQPALLARRTVLDLGANASFFGFLALQRGAASVTAVDLDDTYVGLVQRACRALHISRLTALRQAGHLAAARGRRPGPRSGPLALHLHRRLRLARGARRLAGQPGTLCPHHRVDRAGRPGHPILRPSRGQCRRRPRAVYLRRLSGGSPQAVPPRRLAWFSLPDASAHPCGQNRLRHRPVRPPAAPSRRRHRPVQPLSPPPRPH